MMPDPVNSKDTASEHGPPHRPVLTIDYALYEDHLTDSDLTDDQKREVLDALWSIIVAFVDLGFAVEPAEGTASEICGKIEESCGEQTRPAAKVVQSFDQPIAKPFELAATDPAARKEES